MVLAGDALEWHEPIDTCLAFGLRSAPKIFTAVVDALQWIFLQQGLRDLLHYLDDFLFVEPTGQSGQVLPKALATCTTLVVPVVPEKLEGPATASTILGIGHNTAHTMPASRQVCSSSYRTGETRKCV